MNVKALAFRSNASIGGVRLTTEQLAALAARVSRSDTPFEELVAQFFPEETDEPGKVEQVFRFLDFGHQSIADSVVVPMSIEGISEACAMKLWELCPLMSGTARSSRYLKMKQEGCVIAESQQRVEFRPDVTGKNILESDIPQFGKTVWPIDPDGWYEFLSGCFRRYNRATHLWEVFAREMTDEQLGLPEGLDAKKSDRLRRNVALDRSRYFLPLALKTGMVVTQSAREWNRLIFCLVNGSIPTVEGYTLAQELYRQLKIAAPGVCRVPERTEAGEVEGRDHHLFTDGRQYDYVGYKESLRGNFSEDMESPTAVYPRSWVIIDCPLSWKRPPANIEQSSFERVNRYDSWTTCDKFFVVSQRYYGIALAEARDLIRNRPGSRHIHPAVLGFYCATEQKALPRPDLLGAKGFIGEEWRKVLNGIEHIANECRFLTQTARIDNTGWAGQCFGSQTAMSITTTGDKWGYFTELRSGLGAHFRYARHVKEAHEFALRNYGHYNLVHKVKPGNAPVEDV